MAHGTPDWGVTAGQVTTYQMTDLGELAARLGSIVTHDRRGDVIWLDDMEAGLAKWVVDGTGTGNAQDLSTTRARNGLYSARLVAGTGTANWANMYHLEPFPVVGAFGMEYSFSLANVIGSLTTSFLLYDGTSILRAQVDWDVASGELRYRDAAGAWIVFATGVNLSRDPTLFHTCKLVADTLSKEYYRFILDEDTYSLKDIALQTPASALLPHLEATVEVGGADGLNATAYVDDVILTQNEVAQP